LAAYHSVVEALTDLLRAGAQELLATAVRAEVLEFMASHVHLLDDEGRQRLVRHGFLPEREVMTIARQAIA
jgi:putative transposase